MSQPLALRTKTLIGRSPGPHLLITGGVHGDEFEPMAAARRLARLIDPSELSGKLTLVPIVNEPAFLRGQRTAEDGLDLARACPGKPDGSITQKIAYQLSALIRAADYYVDLHTGGTALKVLPLVGYSLHENQMVLDQQRRMARAFNLPILWGTTPRLEGRSLSVARDANVPAIYAEWGGGGGCDPAGVAAYVDGCLGVMAELKMLKRAVPFADIQHIVEDPRAGSGHMQLCHPAPGDGFFEASVELGQRVSEGDKLGTVSDPLGDDVLVCPAQQTGLLICLRIFPKVSKGDSLGVILETDRAGESQP